MNGHEESFKTINLNDCKDSFSSSNRLVTFELINSRLFDSLSFSARQHYSLDYLEIESKRIAECLKKRADSSRCYSFKADVVHSKEVYREEDMVMKYPHPYHVILNNPDALHLHALEALHHNRSQSQDIRHTQFQVPCPPP